MIFVGDNLKCSLVHKSIKEKRIQGKMEAFDNKFPHVLIVDDNATNLRLVENVLMEEKCYISTLRSGFEALNYVKTEIVDLILLDIMMPGMDGFETCRKLKENPKTREIPVIFLTAKAESEDILKGFRIGAVDYVIKPFRPMELLARVRIHLDLKKKEKELVKINNERKELIHILCHDLANPINNISVLLQLTSEDPSLFESQKENINHSVLQGTKIINMVRRMITLDEKTVVLEKVNLKCALEKSLLTLDSLIKNKKLRVIIDVDPLINIHSEETSLVNSVFNNLLTNAIKYSYRGSEIQIEINDGKDFAGVVIKDFGIGMPRDLTKSIFDSAKVKSRPGTEGEKGTGYGMPLVKKFIESYGGSISLKSREKAGDNSGHGTEVYLNFKKSSEEILS